MTSATKRSAPSDTEPLRLSRSMTADDPIHRHLLLDHHSPPPMPPSTRRRVNPEALSVRLGRELVAELESFLQPGVVEMPSFAVRQEIQTRYKVDRRHIYDWFHSKGLRVTKEDKHATTELKTDAMRVRRVRMAVQSTRTRSCLSKSVPKSLSGPPAARPPPTPTPMISPDYTIPALSSPWISEPENDMAMQINSTVEVLSRPPLGASRTFRDPHIDGIFPIDENVTLNYAARKAYYDTLSRIIGPADGVQECCGTYGAYMAKQLKIYYDRILPCNNAVVPGSSPVSSNSGSLSGPGAFIPATQPLITGSTDKHCSEVSTTATDTQPVPAPFVDLAVASTPFDESNSLGLFNGTATGNDVSLGLCDIIISPLLQECAPPRPPRSKTVSFALDDRALLNFSSLFVSQAKGSFYNQSSSSLAGALGELESSMPHSADQEVKNRSKEWNRPRMGRARAYSGGGGM